MFDNARDPGANRLAGALGILDWIYEHGPNPDSVPREEMFMQWLTFLAVNPDHMLIDPERYIERINAYGQEHPEKILAAHRKRDRMHNEELSNMREFKRKERKPGP